MKKSIQDLKEQAPDKELGLKVTQEVKGGTVVADDIAGF